MNTGTWFQLHVDVATLVPVTLALVRRIQVEEAALTAAFGQEYLDDQRRTWRLVPWVY